MNRTHSEVLAEIHQWLTRRADPFARGYASNLALALPLEAAKRVHLVKVEATEDEWARLALTTLDRVRERLVAMIEHAWVEANKRRGMNMRRNLHSLRALVWLMGPEHDDLLAVIDEEQMDDLKYYGKRALVKVSEAFDVVWAELDDDEWQHIPNAEKQDVKTAEEALR